MTSVHAKTIFRDYNTEGVATSGKFRPRKGDIRTWGRALDWLVNICGTTLSTTNNTDDTINVDLTLGGAEALTNYYNGLMLGFILTTRPTDLTIPMYVKVGSLATIPLGVTNGTSNDIVIADALTQGNAYIVLYNSAVSRFILINPDTPRRQTLRVAGTGLIVDRTADDGGLVVFQRDRTNVGTITVAAGVVSYGSFSGMHWSQLTQRIHIDIPMGTVLDTIDEMCEWPGQENMTLPRVEVSRKHGSTNVYGVFRQWDEDGDVEVASLGVNLVRITPGMIVERGDLLMSNGNGCATPQLDDVIRAATIGKVLSSEPQIIYSDQSYLVPATLYCG